MIVLILIINVVFFATVFISMDSTTTAALNDPQKAEPWLLCLVVNDGDKDACLKKTSGLVVSEATVMAVLLLISVCCHIMILVSCMLSNIYSR